MAGGLGKGPQTELYRALAPLLVGNPAQGQMEMWRTAASLERISAKHRRTLGEALLARLAKPRRAAFELWALGRLGARIPFYGPLDTVVSRDTAEEWTLRLLEIGPIASRDAAFALTLLARRSGDRARDIDEDLRRQVADALRGWGEDAHLVQLVQEIASLAEGEQAQAFGESLPLALRLTE